MTMYSGQPLILTKNVKKSISENKKKTVKSTTSVSKVIFLDIYRAVLGKAISEYLCTFDMCKEHHKQIQTVPC